MTEEILNEPNNKTMHQATSIQTRLEDLKIDFDSCKTWYDNAYKKYRNDRKFWGSEADPNEYLDASRQLELIKVQVKLLEWALTLNKGVYSEAQLRKAFQCGQQWVHDISHGIEPATLNQLIQSLNQEPIE